MHEDQKSQNQTFEAEVIESSVIEEDVFQNILIRAGRTVARPALEAMELLLDNSTPPQVRITMLAALTYLLMPLDLIPDFIPLAGFSDDLMALTAVIGIWRNYLTPTIRQKASQKLDRWLPI
tara:strand:- start:97 stop:462 length:366 start_codon:yes stop_codon:yes gene_type:complete